VLRGCIFRSRPVAESVGVCRGAHSRKSCLCQGRVGRQGGGRGTCEPRETREDIITGGTTAGEPQLCWGGSCMAAAGVGGAAGLTAQAAAGCPNFALLYLCRTVKPPRVPLPGRAITRAPSEVGRAVWVPPAYCIPLGRMQARSQSASLTSNCCTGFECKRLAIICAPAPVCAKPPGLAACAALPPPEGCGAPPCLSSASCLRILVADLGMFTKASFRAGTE